MQKTKKKKYCISSFWGKKNLSLEMIWSFENVGPEYCISSPENVGTTRNTAISRTYIGRNILKTSYDMGSQKPYELGYILGRKYSRIERPNLSVGRASWNWALASRGMAFFLLGFSLSPDFYSTSPLYRAKQSRSTTQEHTCMMLSSDL